jgi:hypothetical protein
VTFSFAGRHSKFEHGGAGAGAVPEVTASVQRLVVIGRNFNADAVRAQLEACLLNDEELKGGPEAWRLLPVPFDDLD